MEATADRGATGMVPASADLSRLRRYTWWMLVPWAPLLGLVSMMLMGAAVRPLPVAVALAVLALAIAALTTYLLAQIINVSRAGGPPAVAGAVAVAWWGAAGATLLGLIASAAAGGTGFEFLLLAGLVIGVAAVMLRPGRRLRPVFAAALAAGAVVWMSGGGEGWHAPVAGAVGAGTVLLIAWAVWQTWWYYEVALQLDRSRTQAAELAVANERLRFAAELHDIQGHHLQVIALKSELAARLAHQRPAEAAAAMQEVQGLAREALSDTRSLVGGYRQVSLGTEIANATRVLDAAGIATRPRIAVATDGLGEAGRLLGLVVREATTNILRHATARRARIELDQAPAGVRLVVANDGASTRNLGEPAGAGLPGLAERLAAVGGTLRWSHPGDHDDGRTDGEFALTATVPAPGGEA